MDRTQVSFDEMEKFILGDMSDIEVNDKVLESANVKEENPISSFLGSDKEIALSDKKEIENTIDLIDTQLQQTKKVKDLKTPEEIETAETSIDSLTKLALQQVGKIDSNSDKIFDLFYEPLARRIDHSDVSKQSLIESQRLKIEMMQALASLASAKAKLELAKAKNLGGGGNNIMVGIKTGDEVGVSISSLWDEAKKG